MATDVAVVVPWQPGCPHRETAWEFLRPRWERFGTVIEGRCEGPWVKAAAVADALERTDADVLVIADADVWVDPTEALAACKTWAVPHLKVHRLSEQSTALVLTGADWRGLPLAQRPYKGRLGGGVTVINRTLYESVPMDLRFVGWGQEDESWAIALSCLAGEPWRGSDDLVHLWHPPQDRMSRVWGSDAGRRLRLRYAKSLKHPDRMRAIVEESKRVD